ncbi:transcriptional regulator [Flavobacterium sp. XS2P12]|uniref:transcriptional regulator n=1 Tax=Flavobacterium melibiosi TaxID=3398734 RepID=UPI003A88CCD6
MTNNNLQNNKSKDKKPTKVFLIDRYICNYICEKWMSNDVSNRSFGKSHGIHEGIVRKIKEVDGYKIPVSTLTTICFYKGIKMSDFFKLIEEKYGPLNDDFEIIIK